MFWIDSFGEGFSVWFGPEMVDIFQTIEEAEAYIGEMQK